MITKESLQQRKAEILEQKEKHINGINMCIGQLFEVERLLAIATAAEAEAAKKPEERP